MAELPRDLARAEQRLAAVGAVEQVMRAVWALARAQLPLVEAAAADANAHLDEISEIVDRLAGPAEPQPPAHTLTVVLGPERPLCGPLARSHLDALPPEGDLGLVGTRLCELADQEPGLRERVRFSLAAAATPDEIPQRADALAGEILERMHRRSVELLYASASGGFQQVTLLAGARALREQRPETLSPVEVVLEAALAQATAGRLAVALAEALRAEVRARLTAADVARQACERESHALRQRWRVLRQESITAELLELSAARRGFGRGGDSG